MLVQVPPCWQGRWFVQKLRSWLQKRPPQPSTQLHCQGCEQVPCRQPGYRVHCSHVGPSQPIRQLFVRSRNKHETHKFQCYTAEAFMRFTSV